MVLSNKEFVIANMLLVKQIIDNNIFNKKDTNCYI